MSGTRAGSSVVEAVVATLLAGIAVAGLAATAAVTVDGLRLARDSGTALALASERLEALRVGSRANGTDAEVAADGTRFLRTWFVVEGRGRTAATARSPPTALASCASGPSPTGAALRHGSPCSSPGAGTR